MTGAENYEASSAFVGPTTAYYRASGTSFAAPFVTGVASLLLSKNPELTAQEVTRMILQSAKDIDAPGVDQFTGYGRLDAVAALKADPEFFIEAAIKGVKVVQRKGKPFVQVFGTADANKFKAAVIEIGKGETPTSWKKVADKIKKPVKDNTLGDIPAQALQGAKQWTVRVITEHKNGRKREGRFVLKLG